MSLENYALNERIALALGFRQELGTDAYWHTPQGYEWWDLPGIPDWAGDKNLTNKEMRKLPYVTSMKLFQKALEFIIYRDNIHASDGLPHAMVSELWLASPLQEAEALVMTLEGLAKP